MRQMEGKPQQLAVVLFFERSYNKKASMHYQLFRLFSAIAPIVHRKACFDRPCSAFPAMHIALAGV